MDASPNDRLNHGKVREYAPGGRRTVGFADTEVLRVSVHVRSRRQDDSTTLQLKSTKGAT